MWLLIRVTSPVRSSQALIEPAGQPPPTPGRTPSGRERVADLVLGLGQRLLVHRSPGRGQSGGVVLFLADAEAEVHGAVGSVLRLHSFAHGAWSPSLAKDAGTHVRKRLIGPGELIDVPASSISGRPMPPTRVTLADHAYDRGNQSRRNWRPEPLGCGGTKKSRGLGLGSLWFAAGRNRVLTPAEA